ARPPPSPLNRAVNRPFPFPSTSARYDQLVHLAPLRADTVDRATRPDGVDRKTLIQFGHDGRVGVRELQFGSPPGRFSKQCRQLTLLLDAKVFFRIRRETCRG